MPRLYETLSPRRQLELAVQANSPSGLAQTFATFVGQFYDRAAFDDLARQVSELYDAEHASIFRAQLDRRLSDRYRMPVDWDAEPVRQRRAA